MTIQGQAIRAEDADARAATLPPTIAFLASHGVGLDLLREAARAADRIGVSADEALLRSGRIDETTFYRALAHEAGLPFLSHHVELDPATRFPESVLAGIVPLREGQTGLRFALAPRGPQLEALLAARARSKSGLAIVTPSTLKRLVFRSRAVPIAWRAANELQRARPQQSARDGIALGQIIGLAAFILAFAWVAAFAPAAARTAILVLLSGVFLLMAALRIAAALEHFPVEPLRRLPGWSDRDLPIYTVIVPLHREERMLPRLIAALTALDYPAIMAQTPQAFGARALT